MNPGLFSLYAGAPAGVQAHVRVRWLTCPFRSLSAHVPQAGRILEVGSGYGLLALHLALASPRRTVVGIDIDAHKVVHAQRAAALATPRGASCSFELAPPGEIPPGPWDAVVVVDVLYLLDPDAQAGLVRTCASGLGAGGVLLVKEMDVTPRWKARWNRTQETLSVRVLRITAGDTLAFLPPAQVAAWMEEEGLAVTQAPLGRGYPHPHHLVAGRRPTLSEIHRPG